MAAAIGCAQKTPPQPGPLPTPFKVVATPKQVMQAIVIPASDAVWKVANEVPKDDAEWLAVENHALALAESANLLMMEGRAVDHDNWMKQSKALLDTALTAAEAAHAKHAEKVADAGNAIYEVCEACHMQYMKQEQ
jgi:hypothetical protein